MSSWQLIFRSLQHHWRIHLAVALGVMAATAVLTGALLVGDSVRGSLLDLTLDRLGRIDFLVVGNHFFRAKLADELVGQPGFDQHFQSATAAILLRGGTVEHRPGSGSTRRASGVLVVGCDQRFWELGRADTRPEHLPGPGEIVLNEALARELGIDPHHWQRGQLQVTLRLPRDQAMPADLFIAKKEGLVGSLPRLRVVDIVPARGLGRFNLQVSQSVPHNAFVSLQMLQRAVNQPGRVNTILVAGATEAVWRDAQTSEAAEQALQRLLPLTLDDCGLMLKRARLTFKPGGRPEEVIYDYFSFSSRRLLLDDETAAVADRAFRPLGGQPVFTYLANAIAKEGAPQEAIPYSMISAIDVSPHFAPRSALTGRPIKPLADEEIVLSQWAQQDLGAQVGDKIVVTYYDPESVHGTPVPRQATFKLKDVVPLTQPARPWRGDQPAEFDQRPTLLNDPDLTPFVPGLTDRQSIERWDLPFDTSGIRPKDDEYWRYYRTTPKALISLAAGRRLWQSRFGATTSYRIPAQGTTAQALEAAFLKAAQRQGARLGLQLQPIKRQGYESSRGTTPFDLLFLALSMFIIAAALMLVALLFRLGVEQRASQLGILLAAGWPRRLAARVLTLEGALVADVGALWGVLVGVGYAWLMLAGLRTVWVGAILTPFLQFHWSMTSLVIGYVSGLIVSTLTIAWSVRQMRGVTVRQLLAGQAADTAALVRGGGRRALVAGLVMLVGALALVAAATQLGGEAQAGTFVSGGVLLLAALLLFVWRLLRYGRGLSAEAGPFGLAALAARNAGRHPLRSTITIGLVAFASFLIVSMSCFRMVPTEEGTGGFDLIGQSSRPIFADLNTAAGRRALLDPEADVLAGGVVLALRLRPGDEASCNNLYRPVQPRVLGVTRAMIEYFDQPDHGGFRWADSDAANQRERANPWHVLERLGAAAGEAVPVVLDKNTAMYSLQLYGGIGQTFSMEYDARTITFRVAGLLAGSVLQGSLLISEQDFERLFPDISGYRYFLIRSPAGRSDEVARVLEDRLGDQGFDAVAAADILRRLLAVQNTYLSTFQSLGALGLLLGTFGLAAVQLRSVLERRGELALLRAAGFRRGRLAQLVMLEHAVLLVGGLATGVVAALLAVLPHMLLGAATVPLGGLAAMLAAVLLVGLVSGLAAVRATLRAPLLAALRGE